MCRSVVCVGLHAVAKVLTLQELQTCVDRHMHSRRTVQSCSCLVRSVTICKVLPSKSEVQQWPTDVVYMLHEVGCCFMASSSKQWDSERISLKGCRNFCTLVLSDCFLSEACVHSSSEWSTICQHWCRRAYLTDTAGSAATFHIRNDC